MLARGKQRLKEVADGIGAVPIACDVADPGSVDSAFDELEERFGVLDALLNVAGVAKICRIEHASDDDIAFVMGVNLPGPIYTTRAAVPLMRKAGGGDIINVSSEITNDYMPSMVLYGASKGAWTRSQG
jgi:NAD(P)-dependent dehydrogenase (short-subunit alcohol dehydrogenase family)